MFKSQKYQDNIKSKKPKERDVFNFGPEQYKRTVHHLSEWWAIGAIVLILLISLICKWQIAHLPDPLKIIDAPSNPTRFIAERAWADLRILNEFGPRVVGSYANEILTVDFFKRETSYIQQLANKNQRIDIDVQQTTGSYWLEFKPYGLTNSYRSVQNVIVRLAGNNESNGQNNATLMLNCHYDSVPGSPGASDDAASCCVMLEILRVLSKQTVRNQQPIVFLFNGAEETPLQAAHGFITQHRWASDVKAFINLESAGSNGKEILFQNGPNHPWLIEMYKKSAYHPFGHVVAAEIFQSGIIPSDTDFRVFRDFANIPGLDFAHAMNGYRYHTKYDHIDYLSPAVLQNTGNNILALTKEIANSIELTDTQMYKDGKSVYFDILGLFFLSYSETIGIFLNILLSIAAIWIPHYFLRKTTKGVHVKFIRRETIIGFFTHIFATILSVGVCYAIAEELDFNYNTMSWYHHTFIAAMLYSAPAVMIQCAAHWCFSGTNRQTTNRDIPLSISLKVQARLNGINILWSLLIVALTALRFCGAYVFMVPVFCVTLTNLLIGLLGIQNSIKKWLYTHLIGQIFVVFWIMYFYHVLFGLMIPITGRSGGTHNPEIIIGILSALLTTHLTSYLTPLVGLLNRCRWILIILVAIFLTARIGLLTLTDIGFPYRDNSTGNGYPTPQRHHITHTTRKFYDHAGKLRYGDSGFWFRELDRNSWKTIESLVAPDILVRQTDNSVCSTEAFCGLPITSIRQLYSGGFWLPGPQPIIREQAQLELSAIQTNGSEKQFDFILSGHVPVTLYIRLKPMVELIKWNLLDHIPPAHQYNGNEPTYFIIMAHGNNAPPFNLTLHVRSQTDGPKFDITRITHHFEYNREHTPVFASMLAKLPSWAFAVPSVTALVSQTFA